MSQKLLQVQAPAKINLFLDVLGKRKDGYHEVKMVMQSISLSDRISFMKSNKYKQDIELIINNGKEQEGIPVDENNLIIKALRQIQKEVDIPPIKVVVDKSIPVSAGLAGGSSNAAAALWGINQLFDLKISQKDLIAMGKEIGSDVPFCFLGGTMLAEGRGEKLSFLPQMPDTYFVLIKPEFGVSTGEVYQSLDMPYIDEFEKGSTVYKFNDQLDTIISGLTKGTLPDIVEGMYNRFQALVYSWHEELEVLSKHLMRLGALKVLMSGSGSVIFGIFDTYYKADKAKTILSKQNNHVFIAMPYNKGVGKESN